MKYFFPMGIGLACLSNTAFAQDTAKDEILTLCGSAEGIDKIAADESMFPNYDRFQAAALRNSGENPEALYRKSIEDRCAALIAEPEIAESGQSFSFDPTRIVAVVSVFDHPSFGCSASWDKDCKGKVTVQVPSGYQACGISYKWRSEGDGELIEPVKSVLFHNGDEQKPARFRGYEFSYKAAGNGQLIIQHKGKISISGVKIYAIDASFDNEVRFRTGCDLPDDGKDPMDDIVIPPET
ncbi:MAG: hypothetical protein COA41_20475 [Sphingopyxis sp.]|nr:MAG: hypothetical protein COA41_20475 [Sphingopyxis sp.]